MKFILTLLFNLTSLLLWAQNNARVEGLVKDSLNQSSLEGVTVAFLNHGGTKTNAQGKFQKELPSGTYTVRFSYAGFLTLEKVIVLNANQTLEVNISLTPNTNSLKQITISGSRFLKPISEEVVSIEVIKPTQILNQGNNSMDDALNRVAGVDVIENQVNIRGGAGWSYGAGSRVLVLVDDMPMLTADAADAKFDFLPLENCEQIEILKGASSSLYGSSALNGVVNFRTGFAREKPRTKAMLYNGMFGNPKEKDWQWWGKQQPNFQGGYLMHAQKFGQLDAVIGSAWYSEDSYLQGDLTRRIRMNTNLRYRSKKIEGLIYGINVNGQIGKSQTFFFWQPDSTSKSFLKPYGGLEDSTTTINKNEGKRFNVDPYITYLNKTGGKHILRTRWFRSQNDIPEKNQSSSADLFYGEYQFQKSMDSARGFLRNLRFVGGLTATFSDVKGELYGTHTNVNMAPYIQLEKKIQKLWTSVGARVEMNQLDDRKAEIKPVIRLGANYEIRKATFLRASFGQGYRYPSIAERFISTSFGASKVFPNKYLQSETGWSSELGLKQGIQMGSWMVMLDAALFWTEYKNMMEFNFGFHAPEDSTLQQVANPLDYLGFKSINVGHTRINGIDISTSAFGKINRLDARYMLGYTYMNPTQVNPDSTIRANISGTTSTLKYRYRHSIKFDQEYQFKKISVGSTLLYNSFMQNIDAVFGNEKPDPNLYEEFFEYGTKLPTTIKQFRKKYNKGALIIDVRTSLQLTKQIRLGFIIKNVLNTIYSERPALIAAPRNFTLQLGMEL